MSVTTTRFSLFAVAVLINTTALSQEPTDAYWTLERTIEHARSANLDVRQAELNSRASGYLLQQSRLGQLPNAFFNTSFGHSQGTSIDPTTNDYTRTSYNYLTFTGGANLLVFGWLQQRNTILKNRLNLTAANHDLAQKKDEVMWAVTTAYLRVLLNWEQMKVNEAQVAITRTQIGQVAKFVKAGTMPDLSLAQLQAQLAGDSAGYILSQSEVNAAIVDMRTLLNIPQSQPFLVTPPDADELAAVGSSVYDPEAIYTAASNRLGALRAADLRIDAARKGLSAAKGALLPQLSLGATFVTAYSSSAQNREVIGFQNTVVPNTYVADGGSRLPVYQQSPVYNPDAVPFFSQLDNFFRRLYTVNLTMPLFNGWASNYSVRQARIALEQQELNQSQAKLALREGVYKAYNDARNSIQTYQAAKSAVSASQRSLSYAQARQGVGLTSIAEYLSVLNASYIAKSKLLSAKYDMFFKMKLVDFYMGRTLTL